VAAVSIPAEVRKVGPDCAREKKRMGAKRAARRLVKVEGTCLFLWGGLLTHTGKSLGNLRGAPPGGGRMRRKNGCLLSGKDDSPI